MVGRSLAGPVRFPDNLYGTGSKSNGNGCTGEALRPCGGRQPAPRPQAPRTEELGGPPPERHA
eukprot:1679599-Lingulodinium_polyedra.AAC.1